ncbi:hypothetical protein [Jeotgalibacillus sp. R-1-5s-1]|uniref:hypothetical protein n=1 Tax=Jeotgalibacillus sp. R-1-5s-1 TaxID=2555897 RepID=UPI001069CDE5|nr:hypothetical protein [Jeotgalibacillus sp. R-1-5s-1]TFE03634.1 hypothetical protein E2491_02280 [Jeotgalibacillus sp. R-1-5s-1]
MKQVIQVTRKRDYKQERLAVLRMELDYELAVLFEAMENGDGAGMDRAKDKLFSIRRELLDLNGFTA